MVQERAQTGELHFGTLQLHGFLASQALAMKTILMAMRAKHNPGSTLCSAEAAFLGQRLLDLRPCISGPVSSWICT